MSLDGFIHVTQIFLFFSCHHISGKSPGLSLGFLLGFLVVVGGVSSRSYSVSGDIRQ